MQNYICTKCGTQKEADEQPLKCENCESTTFIIPTTPEEIVIPEEPSKESIDVTPVKHDETKTIGFTAKPSLIKNMINMLSLPVEKKPFFPKIVLDMKEDGITAIAVGPGDSLLSFCHFSKNYFFETWGRGRIALDSLTALRSINMLGSYKKISIHLDTEKKIVMFYAGTIDKIAFNAESPDSVETAIKSIEDLPLPFNVEKFVPEPGPTIFFDKYFEVTAQEFQSLVDRAKDFDIDYYPFQITKDKVSVGVGDLENPTDGAFKKDLPLLSFENPEEKELDVANIEVGSTLKNIVKNASGIMKVSFIASDTPLWITGEFMNGETVVGKYGILLPPNVEDGE